MNNTYYVYAYLRKDGTPYYIGKGKDKRAWARTHRAFPKESWQIVFLERNLTNLGALALERRYIRWYGRKDLGTGILINLTDGGESNTGWEMPASVKEKISKTKQGSVPWNLGKEHTEETRSKLKEAWTKRPPPSEETKRKMSESHKNKSPEMLEKYKIAAQNRPPVTEATKEKMRQSHLRRKQNQ